MANSVARITLGTLMLAGAAAGAAGAQPLATLTAISRGSRSPWFYALVGLLVAGVASAAVWQVARRPRGKHRA